MPTLCKNGQAVVDYFERQKKLHPENQAILDAFTGLEAARACLPELKGFEPQIADQALFSQGKSLYSLDELPLEAVDSELLLKRLAPVFKRIFPAHAKAVGEFCKTLLADAVLRLDLPRAFLRGDSAKAEALAKEKGLDQDAGIFIARELAASCAFMLSRAASKILDAAKWEHAHCPVCSSAAGLSYISEKEGVRRLSCSFCGRVWRWRRTACAFCGLDKPDNIVIYSLQNKEDERAEVCQSCKSYILSADLRQRPEDVLLARLLPYSLMHLDVLMQEKGYSPGCFAGNR